MKYIVPIVMLMLVGCAPTEPELGGIHIHADFAVFLEGERFDFAQEQYMSTIERPLSNFVHLHDMDGDVVHMHIEGITLDYFFGTVGMSFTQECFILDNGLEFCNNAENTLRMFVNGEEHFEHGEYVFNDLEQILITYGPADADIAAQLANISDKACIQSGTCPERGEPSDSYTCLTEGKCIVESIS